MRPRPSAEGHLDPLTVLDYLDGRLGDAGRRRAEAHLALPCAACRERVRELGALTHLMRLDRVPPVPAALREQALAAFAPSAQASPVARVLEQVARLLFDSASTPLPAAVRHALGGARRLRFALGDDRLELEYEPESAGLASLRGRLLSEEAPLHRIEIAAAAESRVVWPDAGGAFALDDLPAGEATLTVTGPNTSFRLPPITL